MTDPGSSASSLSAARAELANRFSVVAPALLADAVSRLGGADLDRVQVGVSNGLPSREAAALEMVAKRLASAPGRDPGAGAAVEVDVAGTVLSADLVRLVTSFRVPAFRPVVLVDRGALRAIYWDYEWLCTVRPRSPAGQFDPLWDLRGPAFVRVPGGPELLAVSPACAAAPPPVSELADVLFSSAA